MISTHPVTHLDMDNKQRASYSLFRAINAYADNNWRGAEFELECSQEIAERMSKAPQGFYVPHDVLSGKRVMTTASGGTGLKATDHLADSFIDLLRPRSVVMELGATVMEDLVGNAVLPKVVSGGTFQWVDEDGSITDVDGDISAVTLAPKTIGAAVPISRQLLKRSTPSVEQLMLDDLVRGAAQGIDLAALEGGGLNEPTGILNTVGVNTSTIVSAGSPTFAEMVNFETKLGEDNALEGNLAYVTTSALAGSLKTTTKDSGSGQFVLDNGMVNGYPVAIRNGLTANSIIFGNFSELLIGLWGVLDVMPDKATKAASGGMVLRVFQDVDIAVRHPESFCINA